MTESIIYTGTVTSINPSDISYVSLLDLSNNKLSQNVPADSSRLLQANLQPNDPFEIVIIQSQSGTKNIIRKPHTQEFSI